MPDVNVLIEQQNENAADLQQAISNFKKSPKERLTESYIQDYMQRIDDLWLKFQKLDNKFRNELPQEHTYFEGDYYKLLGAKYNGVRSDMESMLATLKESKASTSSGIQQNIPAREIPVNTGANTGSTSTSVQSASEGQLNQGTLSMKQLKLIENLQVLLQQSLDPPTRSAQFYCVKLRSIEQKWKSICMLHESLLAASGPYDLDHFFFIEEQVSEGMIQLQEIINNYSHQVETISDNVNTTKTVKLPTIELPKFNGACLQWRQFRDLFIELVHRQSVPKCQKMWYLKTSLQGEAEQLIRHLSATAKNYDTAWKLLEDRYENRRLLVNTVIGRLLTQPPINNDSSGALKDLHDTTQECLLSLQNLEIMTQDWDPTLLYLLVQKLNKSTHALWEQSLTDPRKLPTIPEFLGFLKLRFQTLENIGARTQTSSNEGTRPKGAYRSLSVITATKMQCIMCHNDHALYKCHEFLKLAPEQRLPIVQKAKRCVNCFKPGHNAKSCSSGTCLKCQKKHNTLLHLDSTRAVNIVASTKDDTASQRSQSSQPPVTSTTMRKIIPGRKALLSTVMVALKNKLGASVQCRALLDNGSQINLISKKCVNRLGFDQINDSVDIEGIGHAQKSTLGRVNIEIKSCITNFTGQIEAHVIPSIVSTQPTRFIDIDQWNMPQNIQLADPQFNKPGSIDILLAAGIFYSILSVGQIALGEGMPRVQNSLFGWIVGGEYETVESNQFTCGVCTEDAELNNLVEKFWSIDDTNLQDKAFTASERRCETFFASTIRRAADGRYVVKLPYKGQADQLGQSREVAVQRFRAVERKLSKDPQLKEQYCGFINEYEDLKHMENTEINSIADHHYFLPHHAVLKPDSTSTKLRVVFDASAKTTTNLSLNDILDKGPIIQDDVFTILMRFRLHRYAFTADIEKMYRQIWMDENDRNMQLVVWREDSSQPLNYYQLNTITYGTAAAPFLAIRTIRQVAIDVKSQFPLASTALETNVYVDDVLSVNDSLSVAIELQNQLINVLKAAGFNLRKWCANHPRLLENIPPKDREIELRLNKEDEKIKTMGLNWHPATDDFKIKIKPISKVTISSKYTKRSILSDTAQIFDPLGVIAPVTVTAKLILQKLWLLKLDWDAAIPQELQYLWAEYEEQIELLSTLRVPRHIFGHSNAIKPQLHIFTDASEKAYGAVAYMRTTQPNSLVTVRIVCAKSRIAPIKQITLPRLELCAAKLGVELLKKLQEIEAFKNYELYCWTDSTAVLGWINSESSNYHTFIANRISFIHQTTSPNHWRHVRSEFNPADLISRGLSPGKIVNNNFWFYGPMFLHGTVSCWPLQPPRGSCSLELRKPTVNVSTVTPAIDILEKINHRNSFRHLQRVIAYIQRIMKPKASRPTEITLQVLEMELSLLTIVKLIQASSFPGEISDLTKHKMVNNSSSLSSLHPFIDKDKILRVGGRLEKSNLSYDAKHPMILPYHHPIVKLIVESSHKENLHAGAQAIMSIIRQRFWPLKLKMLARTVVQNCVKCARTRPQLMQQLMGNLPADRVQPSRPFVVSGVDFFGPLWTHFRIRGKKPLKAYVAVFCCFATKAIHMELVNDLTTEAFLGALKRFIARRGHCAKLYCDNATNFVGAKNYIQELQEIIHSDSAKNKIQQDCSRKGVEFAFIPPRAPHFGGLWEAAVKSAKRLLLGTLAATSLTYEELETLIIEAEAILNSRPLTPLSSDPSDFQALTPGHFLVGEPLTSIVDPRATPNNSRGVSRWKLIEHLKAEFWQRWVNEYLATLQYRHKWKQEIQNVQPGTMVIIKEDNVPVLRWPLGRIIKVIPGSDGLVRVADVRTATTISRRPVHRLAPLPIETVENEPHVNDISEEIDTKESSSPAKRSRLSMASTSLCVLLMCLLLPLCLGSPIEIQLFTIRPRIYFEKLGAAEIQTSEWNFISYVDMQLYWKRFDSISKYPAALQRGFNDSTSVHSKPILNLISGLLEEITLQNQLLQPSKRYRTKRGAFNIVGNIANGLFGVLDSTYAEEAEKIIDNIKQNQEYVMTQVKKQTSFIDTTVNILKRDLTQAHNELEQITKVINRLQFQQSYAESRAELAIQAALDILHLERIQESLLGILVLSHHGKISPELISPQQLQTELNNIKGNLPNDLRLPASTDELLNFYKLMRIEGRATQNYIIFKIIIPLIANEEFELLKLTHDPWLSNGSCFRIQSSYEFLIINLHRDQYLPLRENKLTSCTVMNKDQYLCQPHRPFQKKGSAAALCEVQLLSENNNSSSCRIENAESGPHWIQLQDPNSWIYSANEKYAINAVCGSVPHQVILQYSGILTLRADCSIKQPTITIQGYQKIFITGRTEWHLKKGK